jgi:tetratricopeptide (TPR) repeat protein
MSARRLFASVFSAALAALPCFVACASAHPAPRAAAAPAPDELGDGIELYQQGKFAEAEAVLRRASGPEASAYLAGSLAKQRKYADAEAPAKAALEANGTHDIAVAALGASLVGQGKFDEAVDRLSAALAARADLAYAYYWRAQAFQQQRKADRMVADYEAFLRLAPKAPEAATIQQFLSTLQ